MIQLTKQAIRFLLGFVAVNQIAAHTFSNCNSGGRQSIKCKYFFLIEMRCVCVATSFEFRCGYCDCDHRFRAIPIEMYQININTALCY